MSMFAEQYGISFNWPANLAINTTGKFDLQRVPSTYPPRRGFHLDLDGPRSDLVKGFRSLLANKHVRVTERVYYGLHGFGIADFAERYRSCPTNMFVFVVERFYSGLHGFGIA